MTDAASEPREPATEGSPLTKTDVHDIRAALPVLATGEIYLNAGTLGPVPQAAIDAMAREERYDFERRQSVDLWDRLLHSNATARAALASLTGAVPAQVALMHSTHEGINAALWGIDWRAGDEIVTTNNEHPAAAVPMRHIRDRMGVSLRVVAWDGADSNESLTERIGEAISPRTRAIVVSHVSWLSGRVAPIHAIHAAVPEHVRLIVDGAQAGGIVPTPAPDTWDAYTISGQKWPCGPNGTGGLLLADPQAWLPTFGGAMHVEAPSQPYESALVNDGRRLETSQTAMVPLAGLTAAINWLVSVAAPERATQHAHAMNRYARSAIAARIPDGPITQMFGGGHLLAIELAVPDATDVVRHLWQAGIQVSAPIARNRVRFSFGPWTTTDDVDVAIAALHHAVTATL